MKSSSRGKFLDEECGHFILDIEQLKFSLADIRIAIGIYFAGVLTLLPGVILGEWIILPLCFAVFLLAILRRIDILIIIYVFWVFTNGGAYQYGVLGSDPQSVVRVAFKYYVVTFMAIGFLMGKKRSSELLKRVLRFGYVFLLVAVVSGLLNGVAPIDYFKFCFVFLQWFLFGIVLAFGNFSMRYLRFLVIFIVAIILLNALLGVLQELVLPIQATPDGYVPSKEDASSGLLGIWRSQILTNLCLVSASFFIFRQTLRIGKFNLLLATAFLLQPIISESKSSIYSGVTFVLVCFFLLFATNKGEMKFAFGKILFVVAFLGISIILYNTFSKKLYDMEDNSNQMVAGYFDKEEITDYRKIQAYMNAFQLVSPSGRVGMLLGIGPFQLRDVNSKYSNIVLDAGFDPLEEAKFSTVDQEVTDFSTFICEVGLIGSLVFLGGVIYIFWVYFKLFKSETKKEPKIMLLIILESILFITFNSFYISGWGEPLYFVPFWIITVFFTEAINTRGLTFSFK